MYFNLQLVSVSSSAIFAQTVLRRNTYENNVALLQYSLQNAVTHTILGQNIQHFLKGLGPFLQQQPYHFSIRNMVRQPSLDINI